MSYFKYLKKYWKLIVMNSVVHIYQRFYSIPLWCSWKVVQNLPGRFCDKRSVWQCHMIAWWTEKNLKSFFTALYMGSLSMDFIVGIQSCQRFRWSYNCKILRWNWHFCRLPKKWNETLQMCVYLFQFKGAAILKEEYLRSIMIISTYHICAILKDAQGRQYNQYKDPNTFYAPPHPERLKSALKFRPNLEIRVMFD